MGEFMFSFRSFGVGYILGFGSGLAFRALAENDFEPVRDFVKTSMQIAQKVGDVISESFGRLQESVQDLRAQVQAERTPRVKAQRRPERQPKASKTSTSRASGSRGPARSKASVLHS